MRAAEGDAHVVVALAKVPESDLIEIVESEGAGDGIDENGVGDGAGDNVREVNLEKECAADDGARVEVANADKDQEDEGKEVAYRGQDTERMVRTL